MHHNSLGSEYVGQIQICLVKTSTTELTLELLVAPEGNAELVVLIGSNINLTLPRGF